MWGKICHSKRGWPDCCRRNHVPKPARVPWRDQHVHFYEETPAAQFSVHPPKHNCVLPALLNDPAVLEASKPPALITNITELCFSCWMVQNSLYFWFFWKLQAKPHMYQLDSENVLLELPMDSNIMKNCLHAVERHNRMLLPLFILWNLVWVWAC